MKHIEHKNIVVGLTYDLASDYQLSSRDPKDRFSEFDNKTIVRGMEKAIENFGYTVVEIGNFRSLLKQIDRIKSQVDIVFNTSEGLEGRNREAQVPILLE